MSIEYTPGPLLEAARAFPQTALWNDSADLNELRQSISFGGVGATCNPVIGYTTISAHPEIWGPRIKAIAEANPTWGESQIGWQAIKDMSVEAAKLLEPIFDAQNGRNGRLSVQTDPRFHRDAKALADQAEEFHNLARNIIVKI
ncbi:MAG: transaldolase family protein, partial [Propionibacteriaceae bacterium]|nr:transaldolase family protein [Propionibacteriaceae bacterium]